MFFLMTGVCLTLTTNINAQDSTRSSALAFNIGLNTTYNKDKFQSPYTYSGTNLLINSTFTRSQAKGQHRIDLTYSGGHIKSIVSPEANTTLLLLSYDYLLNLRSKKSDRKFMPSLGMGLHTLLSNVNYLPKIESPVNYLSGCAYLTLSGNASYIFSNKSRVTIQGALPFFGLVYRPDFEINGKTLTKTAFWAKGNLFNVKLEYEYTLTPKLNITATYQYSYFTYDEPRPVTILQNGFLIGLKRTF